MQDKTEMVQLISPRAVLTLPNLNFLVEGGILILPEHYRHNLENGRRGLIVRALSEYYDRQDSNGSP